MNDKEKQIEELTNIIMTIQTIYHEKASSEQIAQGLVNAGYRKIPENAVVLTREELFKDSSQLPREKQVENIRNIILENLDYGYDETARAIYDADYRKIPKLGVVLPFDCYDNLLKFDNEIIKETAEKFAKLIYSTLTNKTIWCAMRDWWLENGECYPLKDLLNELARQYGVKVEE